MYKPYHWKCPELASWQATTRQRISEYYGCKTLSDCRVCAQLWKCLIFYHRPSPQQSLSLEIDLLHFYKFKRHSLCVVILGSASLGSSKLLPFLAILFPHLQKRMGEQNNFRLQEGEHALQPHPLTTVLSWAYIYTMSIPICTGGHRYMKT